jgi:hypothetical protein
MKLSKAVKKCKEQWDHFFETVQKPSSCIFCESSRLYWNGKRERAASVQIEDEVGYMTDILCRRIKCASPECKKSWTIRPPGLMPRRHYQLCVVAHGTNKFLFDPQATLSSVAESHCCSRRTTKRWLNWIAGLAEPSDLIRRLFYVSKETALGIGFKPSEVIKKAANTAKKAFQRTAKVFCLLEVLGMAYEYDPPGFSGMIEAVISNRDRITTYRCPAIPELAR